MSKRHIGYVIELNPECRSNTYAGDNTLCKANVFATREKAREDKRVCCGLRLETIWQVVLDCNDKPVSIIKKVR